MLFLVVRPPSSWGSFLPVAGSLATGTLVVTGLALGAPVLLPALAHFLLAPSLLAPKAARTLVPLQLLVIPVSIFFFAALGVALLPVLHSETAVGLLAAAFYLLEPGLAALWVGSSPRPALT